MQVSYTPRCHRKRALIRCNSLLGYASLVISDRILGRNDVEKIRPRFEKALEEEFTERDGTMLPIRSELTGMTVRPLAFARISEFPTNICFRFQDWQEH